MKFFAVFAAVLALAAAAPATQWTINDLSEAIQNPATPAELMPYLEHALNVLMQAVFSGDSMEAISVATPGGLLPVEAVSPVAVMPVQVVEEAAPVSPVVVAEPTHQWTINDLSQAIQNPATPAELMPYLEHALNVLMQAAFSGDSMEAISVATPGGLLPVEAVSPVAVMPVQVVEEAAPVSPAVVAEPTPAITPTGSPLVQIIVNIKSQEAETPATVVEAEESPVLIPSPVIVVPEVPESVIVVPEAPEAVIIVPEAPESVIIAPAPIEIAPEVPNPAPIEIAPEVPNPAPIEIAPEVPNPAPIEIAPEVPNPAPIEIAPEVPNPAPIEIAPEVPNPAPIVIAPEVNPIDVIAVVDPEVNPIDLLQPVPVAVQTEVNPIDLLQPAPVAGILV